MSGPQRKDMIMLEVRWGEPVRYYVMHISKHGIAYLAPVEGGDIATVEIYMMKQEYIVIK